MKATTHLKKRLIASLIGASVVAIGAAPTISWAQTSNASLRGNAPANTQITAFNPDTGATRQTTSNAQGRYALVGLPPGTYQISAAGGAKHTITLTVASTASLDLTGGGAGAGTTAAQANATKVGAVTVTASTLAEVKTPEIATTISQHMIDTLPQVSQNFLEFADIVPGMAFTVSSNGNTSLRGGAQSTNGVNVYIDGIGQKSYVMGGIAGQNASQGNPFPEGAIGQYKVITSNYKAEYGQISSAAVTAQTKSGTNEFHGSVFERYTNDSFRARTAGEDFSGVKTPSQEKEFGGTLGGPIIKNMAHFFLSYAGKRFVTPIEVTPGGQAYPGKAYLPSDIQSQFGPANLPFNENLYFGKLDFEPTDRDRFELSGKIRKEQQRGHVGGVNSASSALEIQNTDKRYALKWDHSANLWFNELILSHQYTFFQPTPLSNGNGYAYTYRLPQIDPLIIRTGSPDPRAYQNKGQQGNELKDDLTFNDLQWHGNHVIKMGAVYRDLTLTSADAGNIDPQFFYHVTGPGVMTYPNGINVPPGSGTPGIPLFPASEGVSDMPYQAVFTKPVTGTASLTPKVVTKDRQYGAYIQDDWDVTDRLQLNLGVRWDYEDVGAYTNFVTPQNVVNALYSQEPAAYLNADPTGAFQQYAGETYIQALDRSGNQRIENYISNGHNRSPQKNEWQPRLGFSYDIDDDQAHVIHGGAGRSYSHNIYNFLQLEKTKSALPELTVYFKNQHGHCYRNLTPCYDYSPTLLNGLSNLQALIGPASNAGTEVDLLNNNLKTPYSDQFSLGMSNKVGDWQTDVTMTRVLFYDGFAFTGGGRWADGSYFDPNIQPTPKVHGNPIPGFGALILGNNGIRTRNTQVLVSAQKPFTKESGWGMTFAYTHTDAVQNRDIFQHYSFDYATIQDYPFITSNAAPKHRIVISGSYQAPWGIVLGAKLKLATVVPYNGVACYGPGDPHETTFADGGHCHAYAVTPSGGGKFLVGGKIWGTRDVDFQATKHFHLGHGISMYARFDLLNVFNFKNLVDVNVDQTGGPGNERATLNPRGNIKFVPRTVKFEVGANF